jgi:aminopeptidase-like protein
VRTADSTTSCATTAARDREAAVTSPANGDVDLAARMRRRMERLYPVCRSLTGDGVRETLQVLSETVPIRVVSVLSGTQVFDWTIGDEWNVRGAWIADTEGRRVVDFADHNLHLVGYSTPVRTRLTLDELRPHLHTLPDHPDWIPYRTTYYRRDWGFCLSAHQLDGLADGEYDVVVDATLEPGELLYGELLVPGETDEEVIITSHLCHPSLVNDNLSGLTVAVELAAWLAAGPPRRFGYRFVFAPGTIGSLTWLSRNAEILPRLRHGLVLTGLGGGGGLVYKQTRHGGREVDAAASHVVRRHGGEVRGYSPYGYDERQFNAIGFDLPVGRLTRTPHGEYPEYHTSADDLGFVSDGELEDAFQVLTEVIDVLEGDACYLNQSPYGEPQLGARGLYPPMGGPAASRAVMAMLWTLAYSDGTCSLLDIAERAGLDFARVRAAADDLLAAGLLEPAKADG